MDYRNGKLVCIKNFIKVKYRIFEPPKKIDMGIKEGDILTFEEIIKISVDVCYNDLEEFFIPLGEWREKQLNDILDD